MVEIFIFDYKTTQCAAIVLQQRIQDFVLVSRVIYIS